MERRNEATSHKPVAFSDVVVYKCMICGRIFRTSRGCERHRLVCREPVDKDQMSLFDYMEGAAHG